MFLEMRKPTISPNGLGSAIQMQIFFVNRSGRRLPQERRDAIWQSVEYLRIELAHLRHRDRGVSTKEEKIIELLNNELAYALMFKEFQLNKQPKPVYPPPGDSEKIGGRHGYNWHP